MRVGTEGERESELLSQMVGLSYKLSAESRLRYQPGEFSPQVVFTGELEREPARVDTAACVRLSC